MSRVTARAQQRTAPPNPVRWRALLVLGLLVGILGMHALAPGGGMHEHSPDRHMTVAAAVHGDCAGDDCGSGQMHHADRTCVSGAVSGGPALPALVPDPVAAAVPARAPRSYAVTAPDGGRAPPDLAELQLLRI
jgi:hypothetical protein